MENHINNPLAELISDDIYELLDSKGLINKKSVRDYMIRKRFVMLAVLHEVVVLCLPNTWSTRHAAQHVSYFIKNLSPKGYSPTHLRLLVDEATQTS